MSPGAQALPNMPTAPPAPVFAAAPQGQRPKQKSMQPSFLGAEASPTTGQLGTKTLLGQ